MVTLRSIELLALTCYAMAFAAIAAGFGLIVMRRGALRWVGVSFLLIGAFSTGAITAFGHLIKIPGGASLIDVNLTTLAELSGSIILSLVAGLAITLSLIAGAMLLSRLNHRAWTFAMPALLCVAFVVGILGLINISLAQTRVERAVSMPTIVLNKHFYIDTYYHNELDAPTALAFGPDGNLYVALFTGKIVVLHDMKRMGQADSLTVYADGLNKPTGLLWRGKDLYIEQAGKITLARDLSGRGRADSFTDIVTGLPAYVYPLHANFGLTLGPDDRLYFSVGSTSNVSAETNPAAARIWSMKPDGSDLRVHATGVRNAFGMAFNAQGDLFATDNAPNWKGAVLGDELKQIRPGGVYGFPQFGMPAADADWLPPTLIFPQHTSAAGIVFYNDSKFSPEYKDNAFVAFWNTGQIARVLLSKLPDGSYASRWELFAQGLKNPLAITTGPDGLLYVADFGSDAIYKIAPRRRT